ncbi:MAG: NYN domain-containing protein [Sphingomonas bacterium]|nr:NYN domain-containing protein [Sphingomonas bacterium]
MRVSVYVDGFNLYYRSLKRTPYKWLNLLELSKSLLEPDDDIININYFTARISPRAGNIDAPRHQQVYLNALNTLPNIAIHYGRFLPKDKWRPISHPVWEPKVMVQISDTEEKGSDVNLAVHMVRDALQNKYDVALLFSQDTDLCEPMAMVRESGKALGLVCLDGREPNKRLARHASFIRHVTNSRLASAQFPKSITDSKGREITRPDDWV